MYMYVHMYIYTYIYIHIKYTYVIDIICEISRHSAKYLEYLRVNE